jgi:precorrin-6B methylase 1
MDRHRTPGSLTIVGTGMQANRQTTLEARESIEQAEKVLFLVGSATTSYWISRLNSTAESMDWLFEPGKDRLTTYRAIVEHILGHVRAGQRVTVVFYGHPGVFVYSSHEAIRRARLEGFHARMLPGISAEDCLFADLGIDPATSGCQSFEATDFLLYQRRFDPRSSLILWQIGLIGQLDYRRHYELRGLRVLAEVLQEHYPADHETVVYEAAQHPIAEPLIERVRLGDLPAARVTPISTLYVAPLAPEPPDRAMLRRLGLVAQAQPGE